MTLHAEDIQTRLEELSQQWPNVSDAAREWGLCPDCAGTYLAVVDALRADKGARPLTSVEHFASGFILGRASAPR